MNVLEECAYNETLNVTQESVSTKNEISENRYLSSVRMSAT